VTAVDRSSVGGSSQVLCHGVRDVPYQTTLVFTPMWFTTRIG